MTLSFNDGNATRSVNISFTKNKNLMYNITEFKLDFVADNRTFPDYEGVAKPLILRNPDLPITEVTQSYSCVSSQSLQIKQPGTPPATLTLTNVKYEAFRTAEDDSYSTATVCAADVSVSSHIVPTIAGCALGGLVIVVIAAYFLGRKRCGM